MNYKLESSPESQRPTKKKLSTQIEKKKKTIQNYTPSFEDTHIKDVFIIRDTPTRRSNIESDPKRTLLFNLFARLVYRRF